ncbi:MAG: hypothetical protein EOP58_00755 [Sphingomonadales bacterium]|nr:MAG: hypothetical protein EOP58_00755 [Sphingomonadales bacterium]
MESDVEAIVRGLDDATDRVAWAINTAWNELGDVPFPLYQREAEVLAKAAITAVRTALLSQAKE